MTPEDFIPKYESALKSQEWKNVAPLFHDKVCVTFSSGQLHNGISNVKVAFEKNFSLIKSEEYTISNINWVLKDESIATYTFDYSWKGIINGKKVGGAGIGTTVLVQDNGKWLLLIENLHKRI